MAGDCYQANGNFIITKMGDNDFKLCHGVALLASLQAGAIEKLSPLVDQRDNGATIFNPLIDDKERKLWLTKWDAAVSRSLDWHD